MCMGPVGSKYFVILVDTPHGDISSIRGPFESEDQARLWTKTSCGEAIVQNADWEILPMYTAFW